MAKLNSMFAKKKLANAACDIVLTLYLPVKSKNFVFFSKARKKTLHHFVFRLNRNFFIYLRIPQLLNIVTQKCITKKWKKKIGQRTKCLVANNFLKRKTMQLFIFFSFSSRLFIRCTFIRTICLLHCKDHPLREEKSIAYSHPSFDEKYSNCHFQELYTYNSSSTCMSQF